MHFFYIWFPSYVRVHTYIYITITFISVAHPIKLIGIDIDIRIIVVLKPPSPKTFERYHLSPAVKSVCVNSYVKQIIRRGFDAFVMKRLVGDSHLGWHGLRGPIFLSFHRQSLCCMYFNEFNST